VLWRGGRFEFGGGKSGPHRAWFPFLSLVKKGKQEQLFCSVGYSRKGPFYLLGPNILIKLVTLKKLYFVPRELLYSRKSYLARDASRVPPSFSEQ
jgi:hypothetical protein